MGRPDRRLTAVNVTFVSQYLGENAVAYMHSPEMSDVPDAHQLADELDAVIIEFEDLQSELTYDQAKDGNLHDRLIQFLHQPGERLHFLFEA